MIELSRGDVEALRLKHMPLKEALRLRRTEDDLRRLGEVRDYAPGWGWKVMRAREARSAA